MLSTNVSFAITYRWFVTGIVSIRENTIGRRARPKRRLNVLFKTSYFPSATSIVAAPCSPREHLTAGNQLHRNVMFVRHCNEAYDFAFEDFVGSCPQAQLLVQTGQKMAVGQCSYDSKCICNE